MTATCTFDVVAGLDFPLTVVSSTLRGPVDRPLHSHGSLVDRIQLTIFPVISGRTGVEPVFAGAADFDLELLGSRTFDGDIQELVHAPTLPV